MVTMIHGITRAHLEGIQFTLRHAQAAIKRLVTKDTILVGHALDNDLKVLQGTRAFARRISPTRARLGGRRQALKLVHGRVVDTALVYRSHDGRTCSLRELAISLLGAEQENPHDSISDARIGECHIRFFLLSWMFAAPQSRSA